MTQSRKGLPWGDEDEELLRKYHANGKSLTSVAKALDRSPYTISKHSSRLGLTWDRSKTEAAVKAHQDDARERRAALRSALLEDAEKMRQQLFAPAMVFNFGGKDNDYNEHMVDKLPVSDQLKVLQAVQVATTTMERLEKMDSDQGLGDVVGMLDQVFKAIQEAAQAGEDLL